MTRKSAVARSRAFIFIIVLLAVGAAGASAGETESLPLDQALRLAGGDAAELGHFQQCAQENHMCALLAASHLRKRDKDEAAAEYLKQALALGHRQAATTLAFMHTEDERHVEGWAWSYLAYALDDPHETLPEDELQKLFSVRLLATNQQAMSDRKLSAAKTRAEELMTEWWPELEPSSEPKIAEEPPETPLIEAIPSTRANPEYPRALARAGIEGYALVYFEVNRRGRIIDAVPVDFSHPAFGTASVQAIKQWRFKVNATDDRKRFPSTQVIEYYLEDRGRSAGRIGR